MSSAGLPLAFTISETTSTGGDWLITGTSGTTQQPITISILGGLPAGTYKGAITITPTTPGYTPITVAVTLNISATIPAKPTINTNGVVSGARLPARNRCELGSDHSGRQPRLHHRHLEQRHRRRTSAGIARRSDRYLQRQARLFDLHQSPPRSISCLPT